MTDDIEIIHSPLEQTYSGEGHALHIQIYRSEGEPWILEVEDELGTSTVWSEPFATDQAALDAALLEIQAEGVHHFVTTAQQEAKAAEPELLRRLESSRRTSPASHAQNMMLPLSDEELDELEHILLYEMEGDEGMTLDILDGYLHAIVIGPETLMPQQWLPKVWGENNGNMLPPASDMDQLNHVVGLVMRHFNSIVYNFEHNPPELAPIWSNYTSAFGEHEDAESWAYGFCEGVKLNPKAWQALFNDPEGMRGYRPIGLLGADDFSDDQDELTRTPMQREALSKEIIESLKHIHAYWLPVRQAVQEREQSQRMRTKVGRNDSCPCGSGKKFKKCCGVPSELH